MSIFEKWLYIIMSLILSAFLTGCVTSRYSEKAVDSAGNPTVTSSTNMMFAPPGTKHVVDHGLDIKVDADGGYSVIHGQQGDQQNTFDQSLFNAIGVLGQLYAPILEQQVRQQPEPEPAGNDLITQIMGLMQNPDDPQAQALRAMLLEFMTAPR